MGDHHNTFLHWLDTLSSHARASFNRVKRAFGLGYYETCECPVCGGQGKLEVFYDSKDVEA